VILWAEQAQELSDHTFYGQNKHMNCLIIHFMGRTSTGIVWSYILYALLPRL